MPRCRRVPKYCLHRRSGHARVKVNGQEIFLGRFNSPESFQRYQRILAELAACTVPEEATPTGDSLTVVELLAEFVDFARVHYVGSREFDNVLAALRPVEELFGRTPASEFGPRKLRAIQSHLAAAGLSRGVINSRVGRIKRAFKWGVSEELAPPAILQGLQSVAGLRRGRCTARETRPIRPVDDSIFEVTLPHLPAVVSDMAHFQRYTGCRPSEVCELKPANIERSGDIWTYRPAAHKSAHLGHERTIFIGPRAQAVLRPYLLRGPTQFCFSPAESEQRRLANLHAQRQTPLSSGNKPGTNRKQQRKRPPGERYTPNSYRTAVHRACAKAGVEPWHPNRLRHSTASHIRKLFNLEAARAVLGHRSADTTEIYAERDRSLAATVARQLG